MDRRDERTVVMYLRAPTKNGIAQQRAACAALARRERLTLAEEPYVERGSAGGSRPAFDAMIASVRATPRVGGIVTQDITRVARTLRELALLDEIGLRPWLVVDPFGPGAVGRLARSLVFAFAWYERELLGSEGA
jgi:hypothetical protein